MDPKLPAKFKARTASVKGPPPLPAAVDQNRPTPRPPALDPHRSPGRPEPLDEPPPTPRAPAVDVSPSTPRPVPVDAESHDDDDEHTVMRPASAPLPRDAFRDGATPVQANEGEPSVGLPLELSVPEPSARKSRAGLAWALLAAAALVGGGLAYMKQQQPSLANGAAPAEAPKSFMRPPPVVSPGRPRDDGALAPPISTSGDENEALPDEEVVNTPSGVRRRPRPAVARPAAVSRPPAAPAAQAEPATPPAAAAHAGGASATNGNEPVAEELAEVQPAQAEPAAPAPNAEGSAPAAAAPPPAAPGTTAGNQPIKPPPGTAAGKELPAGSVDHENPYGK